MMVGLGIGGIVMPLAAQYLIAEFGWRMAFVVVGAAILLFSLPVLATFLKEKPEVMGLLPDGSVCGLATPGRPSADVGLSLYQAACSATFWLMMCAIALVSASFQACFAHIAAILTDRGAAAGIAALATSIFGGGLLAGRAVSGYLLDHFFAPRVAASVFGCAFSGIALLRITGSQQSALAAAFLIGLGVGTEVDIVAYLTSRYFGLSSFGTIYGCIFSVFSLAGGLGQYVMGAAFDAMGSYTLPISLFCGATAAGAALMMCLGPYRYGIKHL
jgi:predicted MFS family arabinose efflux permease